MPNRIVVLLRLSILFTLLLVGCGNVETVSTPTAAYTTVPPTQTLLPTTTLTATIIPPTSVPSPVPFDTWMRPTDGMQMVYVPAGSFLMGTSEEELAVAYALCDHEVRTGKCPESFYLDEMPQHPVTLDAYWIDRYEVTNGQYAKCVEAGACEYTKCENMDDLTSLFYKGNPKTCLSWHNAQDYCAWAGGRLPTEAEWEYAARGPESYIYPWGDVFEKTRVNYCDVNCGKVWRDETFNDGYKFSAPVGDFVSGASWVGAMNMSGNAGEWVLDWYSSDYYAISPEYNPQGPESGYGRSYRGGIFNQGPSYIRSARRNWMPETGFYSGLGFRCMMPDPLP